MLATSYQSIPVRENKMKSYAVLSNSTKKYVQQSIDIIKNILDNQPELATHIKHPNFKHILSLKNELMSSKNIDETAPLLALFLKFLMTKPTIQEKLTKTIFISYLTSVKKVVLHLESTVSLYKLFFSTFGDQINGKDVSDWIIQKKDMYFNVFYDISNEEANECRMGICSDLVENGDQFRMVRKGNDVLHALSQLSVYSLQRNFESGKHTATTEDARCFHSDSSMNNSHAQHNHQQISNNIMPHYPMANGQYSPSYVNRFHQEIIQLKSTYKNEVFKLREELNLLKKQSSSKSSVPNSESRARLIEKASKKFKEMETRITQFQLVLQESIQDIRQKRCRFNEPDIQIIQKEFESLQESIVSTHSSFEDIRTELKSQWQLALEALMKEQETFREECQKLTQLDPVLNQMGQSMFQFKTFQMNKQKTKLVVPYLKVLDPEDVDRNVRDNLLMQVLETSLQRQQETEKLFFDLDKYEKIRKWYLDKSSSE